MRRLTQTRSRRGYGSMIGLLIVIVIISLLLQQGYFRKNAETGESDAELYVNKGKATACLANRSTISAKINEMTMNSGQRPQANVLRQALGTSGQCPGGGKIQMDSQGQIYCSEHAPAPEALAVNLIDLF